MKKKLTSFLLLVIFCLPSIFPLFHPGFFQSDDGEWMIIRFSAFYQGFVDGQFPVRFLGRLNHEYGYPVANFLYPGFMYLGIPIHVSGFGFVDTIKIIFGASMIGSAIFCFLWLSRLFHRLSSFIGSLFYLYAPYHLFDLYKRGSIGEVLAFAILPFILWQIERKSLFWSSIGIGFLIISHNTLAVLFLGLIIVYMGLDLYVSKDLAVRPVIPAKAGIQKSTRFPIRSGMTKMHNMNIEKKELFKKYFIMVMMSIGLSSFFWVPAFFELQYTVFSQTQVSEWQNYFVGVDLIGVSTVAIFVVAFLLFVKPLYSSSDQAKPESREVSSENSSRPFDKLRARTINFEVGSKLAIFFFIVGILSIFFASSLSYHLWNILPVYFIQFPFRLLSLTIVSISFLTACIVYTSPKNLKIPIVVLSLIILILSARSFLTPSEFFDKGEGFYATNMDTTTVKNEYMPNWVKEKPIERFKEKVEIVKGVGEVENISYNSKKIVFDVEAEDNLKVRINTIYYPGWKASVDNQNTAISYENEKGVMDISVASGKHLVKVNFTETPLRVASNTISVLSLLVVLFLGIKSLRKSPFV